MKKLLFLFAAFIFLSACEKQEYTPKETIYLDLVGAYSMVYDFNSVDPVSYDIVITTNDKTESINFSKLIPFNYSGQIFSYQLEVNRGESIAINIVEKNPNSSYIYLNVYRKTFLKTKIDFDKSLNTTIKVPNDNFSPLINE